MKIINILFLFLLISCYKPTTQEVKIKKKTTEFKLKAQDSIYKK